MIVKLDNSTEALVIAKRVSEEFVLPTFSEEGKKFFSENLAKDVEAAFSDPNVDVYGVQLSGALLGYMAVSKKFHISQLYIVASEQRQGLGRMLIDFIEQQAKSSGVARLTVKASLNAVQFYRKCGFEVTSDVQEVSGIRFQPMQKIV
ncbi:GNAT family N-acetyltransferase [Oscillatoria sp. FACHB-1407]|uniref:GNAT family N-acetyltransferase n=1 Tax=Oscillatoria sp. FACHB-1407 TaxID=2692847 RepID=UPI001687F370|nr:GNAT family N-acetyltransferase [Oscillatoria sp. FACHB-1407]MBD2463054.1 GNAT family N-acetyltransferase [Oscillatoria sp. FACHB-1407]